MKASSKFPPLRKGPNSLEAGTLEGSALTPTGTLPQGRSGPQEGRGGQFQVLPKQPRKGSSLA